MSREFVCDLNFPLLPKELLKETLEHLYNDPMLYERVEKNGHGAAELNKATKRWLNENVCRGDWYIQYFDRDQPIHKDPKTAARLMYLLELGGSHVYTAYYNDAKELQNQVRLVDHKWFLLKTDVYHDVQGIESGLLRIALSVRIHGYLNK